MCCVTEYGVSPPLKTEDEKLSNHKPMRGRDWVLLTLLVYSLEVFERVELTDLVMRATTTMKAGPCFAAFHILNSSRASLDCQLRGIIG